MERVLNALERIEEKIDGVISTNQTPTEKGVIKKMDTLGRITIPITFRKLMEIDSDTELEISYTEDKIVISKLDR